MNTPLLDQIQTPADLKRLPESELGPLCEEIRAFLIESISQTGGHLASNLGVVELTVALHRVFHSPEDQLVFDVGHQCYTHKLLTGRKKDFARLRKTGGISGFPKPHESPHDAFLAGHASTSISAAYGIACANRLQGCKDYTIALIGDGALTGGEAYEAMNNAGRSKTRLVVILNHNDMSISKNVGAFARYLSSMRSRPAYLRFKRGVDILLKHIPVLGKMMKSWLERSKSLMKSILYPSTYFEEMGFYYLGPINGHDLSELTRALSRAKELEAPVVIQVETVKGKGYPFAEENPGAYHATAGFDILNGGDNVTMSDCYSNQAGMELTRLAEEDKRICAITAAMKYGTGLHLFNAAHRERFFDVGIAEEHAVTFAGGLAARGMRPVFCVYSSFLQRGYDQVIHDLAIDQKPVLLCVDRAGLVGEDGETHQGLFDAGFLSSIPHVTVYSPEGYGELRLCLEQALKRETGVVAVRYPRGADKHTHSLPTSLDYTLCPGSPEMLVVSYGRLFSHCWDARKQIEREGFAPSLLKLTRIAPLEEAVIAAASAYPVILFAEEGMASGGIGEQFAARLLERGWKGRYRIQAVRDQFVPQGDVPDLMRKLGLDSNSIAEIIRQEMKRS